MTVILTKRENLEIGIHTGRTLCEHEGKDPDDRYDQICTSRYLKYMIVEPVTKD